MFNKFKRKIIKYKFGYLLYQYYINFSLKKGGNQIRDIVICGMQRSGSTLVYNYIKEILKYKVKKTDTFFRNDSEYLDLLEKDYSVLVKKVHSYSPYLAKRINKNKSIGIFTHRDIRDVLVSSIQKGWINNYREWLENNHLKKIMSSAILYARLNNVLSLSYDEIMESPYNTVKKTAEKLEIPLTNEEIIYIIEKYSIEQVGKQLSDMPESLKLKYKNQFHKNHIADGKMGKWKEYFLDEEINQINTYCKEFLDYFNYKIQ